MPNIRIEGQRYAVAFTGSKPIMGRVVDAGPALLKLACPLVLLEAPAGRVKGGGEGRMVERGFVPLMASVTFAEVVFVPPFAFTDDARLIEAYESVASRFDPKPAPPELKPV